MKTAKIPRRGAFQPLNKCVDGESIEVKIRRIVDEKEPITDGAPIIFTDAKDGVRPEFNPRTDRWEIAIDAMDKVSNYIIVTGKKKVRRKLRQKVRAKLSQQPRPRLIKQLKNYY